jgi:hypothetical protein
MYYTNSINERGTPMYLHELIKLDVKELNKMKKEEIIKVISTYGFQFTSAVEAQEKAKKELLSAKSDELALIRMFAAFIGEDIKTESDYSFEVDYRKHDLMTLAAKVMAKCVDVAK